MVYLDKVDPKWNEVIFPDNCPDSEVIDFLRMLCTFSVDINTKDPKVKDWIYHHRDWIKQGGE